MKESASPWNLIAWAYHHPHASMRFWLPPVGPSLWWHGYSQKAPVSGGMAASHWSRFQQGFCGCVFVLLLCVFGVRVWLCWCVWFFFRVYGCVFVLWLCLAFFLCARLCLTGASCLLTFAQRLCNIELSITPLWCYYTAQTVAGGVLSLTIKPWISTRALTQAVCAWSFTFNCLK